MWRWWLFTTTLESGGDCHQHFFRVKFAIFQAILSFTIFFLLSEAFCGLKYTENAIAACWGSSRRSPRPPSRLGSGHPSTYPTPLGAFGASMLAPSAHQSSCPPDTKSWRRHWSPPLLKVKLRQCKWGMYWIRTDDVGHYGKSMHVSRVCSGDVSMLCKCGSRRERLPISETLFLYGLDALPTTQPSVWKHCWEYKELTISF